MGWDNVRAPVVASPGVKWELMRWLVTWGYLGLLAGTAAADPSGRARADKLFNDGRKYLANGEFSLACTAFEQSQQADRAIGTQLNIALCYEKWGHLATAYHAFSDAERMARAANDKRVTVAHKYVAALESKIARLRVRIPSGADPYAIFVLDGKEIPAAQLTDELVLDPGKHVIDVRVAGAPPKSNAITLKAGERKELELELPATSEKPAPEKSEPSEESAPVASSRSKPRLYGGIALTTAGAAALAVASVVALGAKSDYEAAVVGCPGGMCDSLTAFEATRDARDRAKAMTWVFVGGAVLAAGGVYFIVTSKRAPAERVSVTPVIDSRFAGLVVGGSL